MAQEAGLSAPLWTSTAWGGVRLPSNKLLPLYEQLHRDVLDQGGRRLARHLPQALLLHPSARRRGHRRRPAPDDRTAATPRPRTSFPGPPASSAAAWPSPARAGQRVEPDDIGALGLTKIGCGSVWQGYYMFHGGTNPAGELAALQDPRHRLPQRPAESSPTTSRRRWASTARSGPRTTHCASSTCCWPTSAT